MCMSIKKQKIKVGVSYFMLDGVPDRMPAGTVLVVEEDGVSLKVIWIPQGAKKAPKMRVNKTYKKEELEARKQAKKNIANI